MPTHGPLFDGPNPLFWIVRFTDWEARAGRVVSNQRPQPPGSPPNERTAEVRNASFVIAMALLSNLSPKLDLRTHLIRKITKPHGSRSAEANRIIFCAVISRPGVYHVSVDSLLVQ